MPLQQDVPLLKVYYEMSHRARFSCRSWLDVKSDDFQVKNVKINFFCASHFNVLCDKFINVNISE